MDMLSHFSDTSETQAAQAEQIASGSQRLSEVSSNLITSFEDMNK